MAGRRLLGFVWAVHVLRLVLAMCRVGAPANYSMRVQEQINLVDSAIRVECMRLCYDGSGRIVIVSIIMTFS